VIFRQLFDPESSTYTYLVVDGGEAVLIDPVREQVDRDLEQVSALNAKLVATIETHVHADHVTGATALKKKTGCKTTIARASGVWCADALVEDGSVVHVGASELRVLATPGHTNSCITLVGDGKAFTGDALLIRGCGRTDFQQGDARALFRSVHDKIFSLPPETKLYPAHDYRGRTVTTVAEERALNPRLKDGTSEDAFASVMAQLKLAPPKKIAVAVPANMKCGDVEQTEITAVTPAGFIGGEGI
jgi:glyoxylase-like metal-dependent hydrolase (beta-lactamase superfamily II)